DRCADHKKNPLEGQSKATTGLWQVLSHHRRTTSARRSNTANLPHAPWTSPLPKERPRHREDPMARPAQACPGRASNSQHTHVPLPATGWSRDSVRLPTRTTSDAAYCAARNSDEAILHHRLLADLA